MNPKSYAETDKQTVPQPLVLGPFWRGWLPQPLVSGLSMGVPTLWFQVLSRDTPSFVTDKVKSTVIGPAHPARTEVPLA